MSDLQDQAIRQHCKALRLPTVGSQFRRLAETAIREKQSHPGYLEALLAAEMEERRAGRSRACCRRPAAADEDAQAFEFDRSGVAAAQLRGLAGGDYIAKAEPVLLIGERTEKPIWRRGCAWRPAVSGAGCGSPPRPR